MGRGDKRTRKGKIFAKSFGNARPANEAKTVSVPKEPSVKKVAKEKKATEKKAPAKKAAAKKKED